MAGTKELIPWRDLQDCGGIFTSWSPIVIPCLHAATSRATRELPNAGLEVAKGLLRHFTLHFPPLGHPQRVPQKLAPEGAGHRALGFIDLKLQAGVQLLVF